MRTWIRRRPLAALVIGTVGLAGGALLAGAAGAPPKRGLPDAGSQRRAILGELQKLNQQTAETNRLLKQLHKALSDEAQDEKQK